jgi:hypothetical protein
MEETAIGNALVPKTKCIFNTSALGTTERKPNKQQTRFWYSLERNTHRISDHFGIDDELSEAAARQCHAVHQRVAHVASDSESEEPHGVRVLPHQIGHALRVADGAIRQNEYRFLFDRRRRW